MIAYYKLLDHLNRIEIGKEEFRKMINVAPSTMAKISKNEPVSLSVIDRICKELKCQPGDIMEYVMREEIDNGYIMETAPILGGEDAVSFFKDEENHSFEDRMAMEYIKKQKALKENSD